MSSSSHGKRRGRVWRVKMVVQSWWGADNPYATPCFLAGDKVEMVDA